MFRGVANDAKSGVFAEMDAAFRRISPTLAVLWLLSNAEVCLADVGPCSGGATNIVFGSLSLPSLQNATTVAATSLSCPAGVTATKTWDVCSSMGSQQTASVKLIGG